MTTPTVSIKRVTDSVDIATWIGENCHSFDLKPVTYGSSGGIFYTYITEDDGEEVPVRYFRVSMKEQIIYVTFWHPNPSPDSSWVDPIVEAYLKAAADRGQNILSVEHHYRYHTKAWGVLSYSAIYLYSRQFAGFSIDFLSHPSYTLPTWQKEEKMPFWIRSQGPTFLEYLQLNHQKLGYSHNEVYYRNIGNADAFSNDFIEFGIRADCPMVVHFDATEPNPKHEWFKQLVDAYEVTQKQWHSRRRVILKVHYTVEKDKE